MSVRRLTLFVLCVTSVALGAASSRWPQEPESVFGIAIGKPFPAAGEIADCPVFEPFRRENLPDELCVDTHKGFSSDALSLRYVPLGGVTGDASVELRDGLVRAIHVTFDRRHYAETKALLFERYGSSQTRTNDEPGETLGWAGARVTMTLRESSGEHDRAALDIRELPAAPAP